MVPLPRGGQAHRRLWEGLGLKAEVQPPGLPREEEDEHQPVQVSPAQRRLQDGGGAGQEVLGLNQGVGREQAGQGQGRHLLRQPGPGGRPRLPRHEQTLLGREEGHQVLQPTVPHRRLLQGCQAEPGLRRLPAEIPQGHQEALAAREHGVQPPQAQDMQEQTLQEAQDRQDHRGGVQASLQRPAPEPHPMGLQDGGQTTHKPTTGHNIKMKPLKNRKT